MHPKEFQKLMNEVQDLAVANPTPERMNDWYKLLYVASFRAKRFQEAADRIRREMPALDFSVRRSPTLVGSLIEAREKMNLRKEIVSFMRENMGIIVFYAPGCGYCKKQIEIMQGFSRKWGWNNIIFVNVKEDLDAYLEYGVQVTPDLWVVGNVKYDDGTEERKQMRIKSGLATIADIEMGLLKAYYEWFEGKNFERPEMVDIMVDPRDIIMESSNATK